MTPPRPRSPLKVLDPFRDALIVVLGLALVWLAVSWASGGAAIAEQYSKRLEAEQQVAAQATQLAAITRTLTPTKR